MDEKVLKELEVIDDHQKKISYIEPAGDVKVTFYTGGYFTGIHKTFGKNPKHNVVNMRVDGKRVNDDVKSIIMHSTASHIPEDCDALEKVFIYTNTTQHT